MKRAKLVVIALDAADSTLVHKWASEGYLPTLARLLREGIVAPIATPPAVLEGAVWPTLYTGVSPACHGMYSYLQLKPNSYEMQLGLRADRLTVPPFWQHLSEAGLRLAIIDAPLTRPLKSLNGIQVVNWGAHDTGWSWKRSSSPGSLMRKLLQRYGEYPAPESCDKAVSHLSMEEFEALRRGLIEGVEKKTALLEDCLNMEEWDFFLGVFSESHCAGHQFWHFMDSTHPRHCLEAPATLRNSIRDVYRGIDAGVDRLVSKVSPDTNIIILISHAMGPYHHGSYLLDEVLARLGVNPPAVRVSQDGHGTASLGRLKERLWSLRHVLPDSTRNFLKANLPDKLIGSAWEWIHPAFNPWPQMRAFQVPTNQMTGAIRINLIGRDPDGLVRSGKEYEELCQTITDGLMQLENPATGRRAVQWVSHVRDLFQGPRLDELPDLFVEWDHSSPIKSVRSVATGEVTTSRSPRRSGSHMPGGLLIAFGPDFNLGTVEKPIRTIDICPTILSFFGLERPEFLQGRSVHLYE
jgi:predicted AlkP superfamily phosphohydrolase/phosphomutase